MDNNLVKNSKIVIAPPAPIHYVMETTEKELLKTMINLKKTKLPSQEIFKSSLDSLSKEIDRVGKIFLDNKNIITEDKSSLQDNLSNFDKFINDVPNVVLDFSSNFNNKIKVEPLLKINIDSLNKIDSVINDLGKIINFEKRNEQVNINPLTKLSIEQNGIKFNKRNELVNISSLNNIPNETEKIIFSPKKDILKIDAIKNISTENNKIDFTPKKDILKIDAIENISTKNNKIDFTPKKDILKIDAIENISTENNKIDFTPNNEKIKLDIIKNLDSPLLNINFNKKEIDEEMEFNNNFFDNNKELIEDRIENVSKEIDFIDKFTKGLKIKIDKIKLEFNNTKIKEIISNLKIIRNISYKEIIEIDGLDVNLESFIPRIYNKDATIDLNKKKYYLDSLDFDDDNFIQNLITAEQKIPILIGGKLENFISLSKRYEFILNKRKTVIEDFKETINHYNVMFIQYFNYKYFLMKNIQKFYMKKRPIYQYLSYYSFQKYLKVLIHLNKIIENPEKIFERTIPLIINNTHTNMYFKHFLVIKVLFTLFNEINNTSLFKPDTYIDIFPDMENNQLGIYFLIFNLYYKILDKYTEIFSYSD